MHCLFQRKYIILCKIKRFNSDKQYYHKWIKDKLIDSILRVYCMSNTWSIITMATFSSDLFEGCRFMWYRDFEEIRTQIMWTSFPVNITSKRSCRNSSLKEKFLLNETEFNWSCANSITMFLSMHIVVSICNWSVLFLSHKRRKQRSMSSTFFIWKKNPHPLEQI